MIKRAWRPSDELHLRQVREAAGVDHQALSRRCLLSVSQIQELEGQGNGDQFYSEAIKFTAGSRVLSALGAQPLPAPGPSPTEAAEKPAEFRAVSLPVQTTASSSDAHKARHKPIELPSVNASHTRRKWLFAVVVLVSGTVTLLYSTTGKQAPAAPARTVVPPAPVAQPASTAPPVAPNPEPTRMTPDAECANKLSSTSSVAYPRPPVPSKPGNYVHFVPKAVTTVCVLDGNGKVRPYNLKPGQTHSHFGTPPFKIWHPDATIVQMYYLGWKVTGPSAQEGVTVFQP